MLCRASLRWSFGQAACCLASLNPLRTIIYAGTRTAPHHVANCHQVVGQQNGTKLFNAACNHMSRRMWCGRQRLPMCQCGVSYRWVATGASGKMPLCSYTKESETNGPPPSPSVPACFIYYALLDIRFSAFQPGAKCKDRYLFHSDVTI